MPLRMQMDPQVFQQGLESLGAAAHGSVLSRPVVFKVEWRWGEAARGAQGGATENWKVDK